MVKLFIPQKGDVVWLNFSPQRGREQKGKRPALVISPQEYNTHGLMLACPITSKVKGYPFEVEVQSGNISGAILADHIKSLDWKARQASFHAKADEESMQKVQHIILSLVLG